MEESIGWGKDENGMKHMFTRPGRRMSQKGLPQYFMHIHTGWRQQGIMAVFL